MKCLLISNGRPESKEKLNSTSDITISNYFIPCVEAALNMGYEVILGVNRAQAEIIRCSNYTARFHYFGIYRSVLNLKNNYTAYKRLCGFLKSNKVDILHCNSPIGGVLGRLCGKKYGVNKIIYTAHGFHFYKGAPLINRTLFYWIEKYLAKKTDVVITINDEDYNAAKKLNDKWTVKKVHGVGIDRVQKKINPQLREDLGLRKSDILLVSAGDLNKNKNIDVIIKAMAVMKEKVHYLICGEGPEQSKLLHLVKENNLTEFVHFLGFRNDVIEIMNVADIFVMPSRREGLSRSLMEAMSIGLPCVVSNIRGNNDLIKQEKGGFLCEIDKVQEYANNLDRLCIDQDLRNRMHIYNVQAVEPYYIENVKKEMSQIYEEVVCS